MAAAFPLGWRHVEPLDILSAAGRDFPRGRISEIVGTRSSGRTAVLHALLAASTGRGEYAALVDTKDAFDACSAAACSGGGGRRPIQVVRGRRRRHCGAAPPPGDLANPTRGFGGVALDPGRGT